MPYSETLWQLQQRQLEEALMQSRLPPARPRTEEELWEEES